MERVFHYKILNTIIYQPGNDESSLFTIKIKYDKSNVHVDLGYDINGWNKYIYLNKKLDEAGIISIPLMMKTNNITIFSIKRFNKTLLIMYWMVLYMRKWQP